MTYRLIPKNSLQVFRQLVRQSYSSLNNESEINIQIMKTDCSDLVRETLIADNSGWPIDALLRLKKIIDVASYVGKSDPSDIDAVHRLWDILRDILRSAPHIRPLSSREKWLKALTFVCASNTLISFNSGRHANTRESVEGRALGELGRKGFDVLVDGLGARLAPRSYDLACHEIEKLIRKAGGLHVASSIFKIMRADQRIIDAYFSHARRLSHLYEVTEPETPWHFLYSLALKHLDTQGTEAEPSRFLEKIERLSKNFTAACGFQPHSIYENLNISNSSLEGRIFESVSYDEMMAFPQWQGQVAGKLLLDFFDCLHECGYVFPDYPFEVWRLFLNVLIAKSKPDDFSPIHEFDLVSRGLDLNQAIYFMESSTCPKSHLNSDYRRPSDTHRRNHTRYPIIKAYSDVALIQPLSIASRALCQRLHDAPRLTDKNLNTIAGKALESLTSKILTRAGNNITVSETRYPGERKGIDYEVDLVVESDDVIYFIECKKKSLTTLSRAGQTLNIFTDLATSIIPALKQLARNEHFLRSRGALKFQNGYVLALDNRRIEKIAISLHDHGSLQERSFFVPFVRKMAISYLSASSPVASEVLNLFNKELTDFQKYISWIREEEKPDHAFHDFALSTWWLSIDQLAYMLEKAGNLQSGLSTMRNLTSKSGDFVFELSRASGQDPLTSALRDVASKIGAQAII